MYEKSHQFVTFSNDNLVMELLKSMSKTTQEFKANKKALCPTTNISITPFVDKSLNEQRVEAIKETFPELLLKNFQRIILSQKKPKTAKTDKIA